MKLRSGKNPRKKANLRKLRNQGRGVENNLSHQPQKVKQAKNLKQVSSQNEFDELYKDLLQPGAYTSKLIKYLRRNTTHSLHKGVRKKFIRRKIVTHYPGHITQSDLIDMQKFSGSNKNYNYILVFIDCFSKRLWLEPLKAKSGKETASALRNILDKVPFPIQSLIIDEGLEYKNKNELLEF